MSEVDPLVFKLIAETKAARDEVRNTAREMGQGFSRVERDVIRLENQMKRSSGAISGSLRGLAGTLGTLFTGRELVGMIDSFTRLQNSLRVTGLEGQALESVQTRLLDLSTKYGVNVGELASLYGKASLAGKELGASEAQLLQITEASAQALKISGTNATQAQGALLGLTQALSSGTVRAEEFNQILEGGLQPLLQAAANSERFGGSIAKLRQAVVDGKFSSQEFYQAILAGSADLDAKASKATLTLAGALEALSSRLTVYVGSASSANGVTGALADGLALLADNLDVIIPAIATISALMGTSLAVNAIAGSRAFFALTAAMGGAATAAEAATFAFGGLTGVLSGPGGVVLAIAAVGAGLYYLVGQSDNASKSIDDLRDANRQNAAELDGMIAKLKAAGVQTDELAAAADRAKGSVDGLADSYRQALIEARKFSQGTAGGKLQTLNDDIRASQNRQANLVEYIRAARAANPGAVREGRRSPQLRQAEEKLGAERRLEAGLRVRIQVIAAANDAGVDLDASSPSKTSTAATKPARSRASSGSSGPTQAEKDARAADEEANLRIERLRAEERLTEDATARADLQRQILAEERAMRESDIEAKVKAKALSADQAAEQRKILDALYGQRITEDDTGDIIVEKQKSLYGQAIAREEQERIARQQTDAMRDELAALGAEAGVTDVRKARVEIERRMLEIQQEIERKLLDEAIARGDVADAAGARAALARKQAADTAGFDRDSKGPLGQYLDDVRKVGLNLDDEFEKVAVNGLQSLNDGLTEAIMNSKNLGDVFKSVAKAIIADLIRIAVQQTIVNGLQAAFGGGGGGGLSIGNSGASLKGGFKVAGARASGGPVEAGRLYKINEFGTEGFVPANSGMIIPTGAMNAVASRGIGRQQPVEIRVHAVEGAMFVPRVEAISADVSIQVTQSTAGQIIETAVSETTRRWTRPSMPGAGR